MMCLKVNIVLELCDLYPKTCEKIKALALKKHDLFITYMKKVERVKNMKFGDATSENNEMENLNKFNDLM